MVREKGRSVYRKKRKANFSGKQRQEGKFKEPALVVDEITCSTPSTSQDGNKLSDSNETVGSSRKKMKMEAR